VPTDKAIPMVAAQEVGQVAARLIQENWTGTRVVELEGPSRISPNDLAAAFANALGKPVRAVPVPRESWEQMFRSQGMKNPYPRIRMVDGFNENWIAFTDNGSETIKGSISAKTVIAALVAGARA
jgi:NAD(P)H dehydrogenase (quinone)